MEETRIILRNAGKMNPVSSTEYAATGGYLALKRAITTPDKVIPLIKEAGVRGRSGSGFPVGLKWEHVKNANSTGQKYIVCNADEGEPGTGKDRLIMMEDPHSMIEGMAICSVAVGADKGYIYLRREYPYIQDTLEKTIKDAYDNGYIGKSVMNSAFSFDIELRVGQGSYICGEETGMLESIEGERGEPRYKPPYPSTEGLWGKPTVVNNTETFCNIPIIIHNGPLEYRKYGTENCPGTKLITLSGHISNPGVYEFPIGTPIRVLFEEVGGGCPNGKKLLGMQTGGGSGAIVGTTVLDTMFDIEHCAEAGAVFGTGDIMFFNEDTCIIGLCRNIMEFFSKENCGKCTPCRIGCERILYILKKVENGHGDAEDLKKLVDLGHYMKESSLCGLGQTAPIPVLTALKNFRDVFEARLADKNALYV